MSSHPPRKFAAVPTEETTKSSKPRDGADGGKPKPRRFAPEPVEETTRSSKGTPVHPAETEKPKPRRFAPEPVEHTTTSSKATDKHVTEGDAKPKPRKFAPQLVDETENGTREKAAPEKKLHVKFKPEPIATTYGSNRKGKRVGIAAKPDAGVAAPEKQPPRKFKPILLDTARRSRRAGDPNAPISQDYRTEYGYHAHPREHWKRVNGEVTPMAESDQDADDEATDIEPPSSRSSQSGRMRKLAPLDGSAPSRSSCFTKPQRTHSFRTPELDTIESSESEAESNASTSPPTPGQIGSPITVSGSYELFKHATRRRESIDENWQHYLLDLERKNAQERLEEQALAAYPNADFGYEHPHHYFNEEGDSDSYDVEDRPVTWEGNDDDLLEMNRRESTNNLSWEKSELQRHAEVLQQERNANRITAKKPSQKPGTMKDDLAESEDRDPEIKSMRDRARPPMLGTDIVFPRCSSPDPARFDVTQGSAALRNQMCYLTAAADAERKRSGQEGGLWQVAAQPENKRISMVKKQAGPSSPTSSKGLWGGFCVDDGEGGAGFGGQVTPTEPTGLMTPKHEAPNPFLLASAEGRPAGLMTPETPNKKKSQTDLQRLNSILVTEREIDTMMESEYPDSFITQVYNYLSLGYPSLARDFDDELSKISRVPISELRQDDQKARQAPRGHIRLGADFEGGGGEGMVEQSCMRWRALKRYVREWAKQEKNWSPSDGVGGNWGTAARRGSWGI